MLRQNHVGTEHLLLGLLAQPDRAPAQLLRVYGADMGRVGDCLRTIVRPGETDVVGEIPLTPTAGRTLERAAAGSETAGHHEVTPDHILLSLLGEDGSVAAQILRALAVDIPRLQADVVQSLPPPDARPAQGPRPTRATVRLDEVAPSPSVDRLLRLAGAIAADDRRSQIEIADVEEALRREHAVAHPPQASTA